MRMRVLQRVCDRESLLLALNICNFTDNQIFIVPSSILFAYTLPALLLS